jgi:hypothetical protein
VPIIVVDTDEGPEEVDVPYADLPLGFLVSMAQGGDEEAARALNERLAPDI